jgi:hypothetical protein
MATMAMQSFASAQQGFYNFGQGLNYGANRLVPQGTPLYSGLDWTSQTIANPIYNTLTQPGYNYGQWMYGEKNFRNLLGASLDAAWAISGVSGAIKAVAAAGPSYWQYYPANNPAYKSQWLARGWQPPYKTSIEAVQKLSLPPYNPGNAVRQVQVPWYKFIGGPTTAPAKYGQSGGGLQYLMDGWPEGQFLGAQE